MFRTFFAAAAVLFLMRGTAHAGLDPAVETLMLQAVAGSVAGTALAMRGRIARFVSAFRYALRKAGDE